MSAVDPVLRASAAHLRVDADVLDGAAPLSPTDSDQHHLARVLRLRSGASVTVTDGAGRWRPMVARVDGSAVLLEPDGDARSVEPDEVVVSVAVAIPKGDRLDWMLQKLTELGVGRIVLLHAQHSVVRWPTAKVPKGRQRAERIVAAAAQQSRRVIWPELVGPVPAVDVLPRAIVADFDGPPLAVVAREQLHAAAGEGSEVVVAVGPEGGWTAEELALSRARASLGGSVLRTETAAIAAAALLCVSAPFPSAGTKSLE